MSRWDTVDKAVNYAIKHGASIEPHLNLVIFEKRVGIHVLGCGDFLSSHGYRIIYK